MKMSIRFLEFMPWLLQWEGETYENDPDDPGGATKYGIDQRSHPNEDIRNLTKERAYEIYFSEYWTRMRCDQLPRMVGEVCMNIGVNAGKSRAGKWLQAIVGADVDGIIGAGTVRATLRMDRPEWISELLIRRTEEHYRSIARGRLAKFLKGWLNRNNSLREYLK